LSVAKPITCPEANRWFPQGLTPSTSYLPLSRKLPMGQPNPANHFLAIGGNLPSGGMRIATGSLSI
jgi:hypothetical protein